jgi:hypothetical protein
MKLFAILLAASALLAGCVTPGYDHPPPARASAGDRDRDGAPNRGDRQPNNPPMGY